MKRMNHYSMPVYEYGLEHGTDIFIEYKDENTTDERRKEIEDWLFNLMRSEDVLPIPILDANSEQEDMIKLSNLDPYSVYNEELGEYGNNAVGVTFLNRFFSKELCDIRKPGAPKTIDEGFHDDKILRRAIRKSLLYTNDVTGVFRWLIMVGCGYCVNFRPATAKSIIEVWGKKENCRYFDSSAGYGSRLLGSHYARNCVEYVGIDPNTAKSCKEEIEFLDKYYPTGVKKQVLEMGSEDFTSENFPEYSNYFDIYFTSPPYFNTEQYSDAETQSYKKFPNYNDWITGFYQSTIDNACTALKADGIFAINIFEKVKNIRELTKLFAGNNGWFLVRDEKYLLKAMPGRSKNENGEVVTRSRDKYANTEPIWIFKHWSRLLKEGLITEEQAKQLKERAIKDTHSVDI